VVPLKGFEPSTSSLPRLGRGGGYYDRFLSQNNVMSVGVCPSMVAEFGGAWMDEGDVRMNYVVTESWTAKFC
jgi:5-formyltetrahydrofolate cyclo-ligase